MTFETIVIWLFLIIAVEAVTEIFVDAKITAGIRHWLFRKANPDMAETTSEEEPRRSQPYAFFSDLLTCGYCTSVWVAALVALLAPPIPIVDINWFTNWFVATFVLHRLSNCFHIVLMIVKKGRVKTYDIELTHKSPLELILAERLNDGSLGQVGSSESAEAGPERSPEANGGGLV